MQTQCSRLESLTCPDLWSSPGAAVPRLLPAGNGCRTSARCQKPFAVTVKDTPDSRAYLEMILLPFSSYITLALLSKQSHFPLNLYTNVHFSKQRGANNSMPLQPVEISRSVPCCSKQGLGPISANAELRMGFTCRRGAKDAPTVLG